MIPGSLVKTTSEKSNSNLKKQLNKIQILSQYPTAKNVALLKSTESITAANVINAFTKWTITVLGLTTALAI
jgi:hypothetical protein